jgi:preprotein translocase subunit SecG
MYTFILVLLVIDSLVLIAAVLMQAGKGGGLSASFGGASSSSDSFVGTRQAANLLTRTSWWGGANFMALAFILQHIGSPSAVPKSVLDEPFQQAAPTAPAPSTSAPAVPLQPANPSTQPSGGAPANPPKQ